MDESSHQNNEADDEYNEGLEDQSRISGSYRRDSKVHRI